MFTLEHWRYPTKLILAWQAPDPHPRYRWAVGLLERTADKDDATFRYFESGAEFSRMNAGKDISDLESLGFVGFPAFSRKQRSHREGVLEAFLRRLPPNKRSDIGEFRRHFRLPTDLVLPPFAILAITEAKLPSDGFSLVDPLEGGDDRCDLILEIAGSRYHPPTFPLDSIIGEAVVLEHEAANEVDPQAVAARVRGECIGYINRLQAPAFRRWLSVAQVEAYVDRINGKPDRRRLFIFVKVRPSLCAAA